MPTPSAAFVNVNPSVGLIYSFDHLELGEINRCSQGLRWPDGKAINSVIVLKKLGGDPLAIFPAGGSGGAYLRGCLLERDIRMRVLSVAGEVRSTYTLLSQHQGRAMQTQLLEPGPTLSRQELQALASIVEEVAREEGVCVLAGSLPPGVPADFYRDLISRVKSNCYVILDTSGAALTQAVLAGPHCLKVNQDEFGEIAPVGRQSTAEDILVAMEALSKAHDVPEVIVTRGGNSVLAWSRDDGAFEITPPQLPVRNTVAAGDCFIAGWVASRAEGFEKALAFAVATASARVAVMLPEDLEIASLSQLRVNSTPMQP